VIPPIPTEAVSPNPVTRPCGAGPCRILARREAGLGPRGVPLDVDVETFHVGEVEHDPAVGHAVAGDAVAAAADGEFEPALASERHDSGDVVRVRDADDGGGTAIEAAVEDGARLLILRILGRDHPSLHDSAKLADGDA
jgi:hypothetical protein